MDDGIKGVMGRHLTSYRDGEGDSREHFHDEIYWRLLEVWLEIRTGQTAKFLEVTLALLG